MSVKLLTEHHLEFLSLKEAALAPLSLHMATCHSSYLLVDSDSYCQFSPHLRVYLRGHRSHMCKIFKFRFFFFSLWWCLIKNLYSRDSHQPTVLTVLSVRLPRQLSRKRRDEWLLGPSTLTSSFETRSESLSSQ